MERNAGARLILLDANFLISLSQKNADTTWLLTFFRNLGHKRIVGIPAPSWAEVLSMAGPATTALAGIVQGKSFVQVVPFDEMAAIESAHLHQRILLESGSKRGASSAPWQKIKIDRQILAIAVARRSTAIYTDDVDLRADASLLGVATFGINEISLPPEQLPLLISEDHPDVPQTKPVKPF